MTGHKYETEPSYEDTFGAIDLDRTVIETHELVKIIYEALAGYGVSNGVIAAEIRNVEKLTGQSIDLVTYMSDMFGEAIVQEILANLLERAAREPELAERLLTDGAEEFFDALDRAEIPYGIMTAGGTITQNFKLVLTRILLNRPQLPGMIVTTDIYKPEIVATWKRDEVTRDFIVPSKMYTQPLRTKHVVIVDDKDENVESDDHSVEGIQVDTSDGAHELPSLRDVALLLNQGYSLHDISRMRR